MSEVSMQTSIAQAYSNEFKGILFEFLVGQHIAGNFNQINDYLSSIPEGLFQQLIKYEGHLRKINPELVAGLPAMAKRMGDEILSYIAETNFDYLKVELMGKTSGGKTSEAEGDLCLIANDGEIKYISLKLCQNNAYVNTKSAGIRSFFSKYFTSFNGVEVQETFNVELERFFLEMAHRLYEMEDLSFQGRFDHQWVDKGLSELPGELSEDKRAVMFEYYQNVIVMIQNFIEKFSKEDKEAFKQCLYPICGIARDDIVQFIGFHKKHQAKSLKIIHLEKSALDEQLESFSVQDKTSETSSFSIDLKTFILQIRVKPMNKFTAPSMKVNCSVKYRF